MHQRTQHRRWDGVCGVVKWEMLRRECVPTAAWERPGLPPTWSRREGLPRRVKSRNTVPSSLVGPPSPSSNAQRHLIEPDIRGTEHYSVAHASVARPSPKHTVPSLFRDRPQGARARAVSVGVSVDIDMDCAGRACPPTPQHATATPTPKQAGIVPRRRNSVPSPGPWPPSLPCPAHAAHGVLSGSPPPRSAWSLSCSEQLN